MRKKGDGWRAANQETRTLEPRSELPTLLPEVVLSFEAELKRMVLPRKRRRVDSAELQLFESFVLEQRTRPLARRYNSRLSD